MKYIIVVFGILFCLSLSGQRLRPGDECPDFVFSNILNNPKKEARLSDFRDRLVILDFGATTCVPCLRLMPVLDSLQECFTDDLQVFMVTQESTEAVKRFLEKSPVGKKSRLPIITNDSILHTYFEPGSLPHEVWIDGRGKVVAITEHEQITASNISFVIAGNKPEWPVKTELNYNGTQPLLTKEEPQKSHSLFMQNMPGYKKGIKRVTDSVRKTSRETIINFSIIELYLYAFHKSSIRFPQNRYLVKTRDSSRYFQPPGVPEKEWELQNTYCYESSFALIFDSVRRKKMKDDLDFFLRLEAKLEEVFTECLVLISTENKQKEFPALGKTSVGSILYGLNHTRGSKPVLNESCYTDAELKKLIIEEEKPEKYNLYSLNSLLKPYGLELVRTLRKTEMMIIAEQ